MKTKSQGSNPMHQAVHLLSRRDHSVQELRTKLIKKGHEKTEVDAVLNELDARGYLDDHRYALSLLNHHVGRGQGAQKIRYLMQQQGISEIIQKRVFQEVAVDWFELARQTRQKRFGDNLKGEDRKAQYKEKTRQMRFLMSRGFDSEQVYHALEDLHLSEFD